MLFSLLASVLPNILLQGWQAHLQATTSATVEGEKTTREVTLAKLNALVAIRAQQAGVITTGMQHKMFWIPWLIATGTLSSWFGWGVLDSMLYNGTLLPDVAALPPQLKEYADIAWSNLFYSGAGMAGVQVIGNAVSTALRPR